MTTDKIISEKMLHFKKASKLAAWFTLIGVLIVVGSLLFSFFELNNAIAERQSILTDLNTKINKQQQELAHKRQQVLDRQNDSNKCEQGQSELVSNLPKGTIERMSKDNPQIKQIVEEVKNTPPPIQAAIGSQPSKDETTALTKEREGFQALIDGDYDKSITAFQAAENAYNSFHNVYELARLLRRSKAQMNDPAKRKEVFQTIVRQYYYGAPPDLWRQVMSIANQ